MKQVTGNNHPGVNKGVSIQLKLGGHSFSADTLAADGKNEDVLCELLTPKTLLVPQEEFDQAAAEMLLDAAGMPCTAEECVIWSDTAEAAIAVMAFDRPTVSALQQRFADRVHFTTPLLFKPVCAQKALWLCQEDDLLYIKVYDNGLRFAEVTTMQTEADLLYYIELLNKEFKFVEFELCPAGEIGKTAYKVLRHYFKNVRE